TEIKEWTFRYSNALEDVIIPEGIVTIGEYAFDSCRAMKTVRIPGSVKTILSSAFTYCSGLETITFVGRAPGIYDNAFYNVNAEARYPENYPSWTEEKRVGYGGTLTWVLYNNGTSEDQLDGATIIASGVCGDSMGWAILDDGTLMILGDGRMDEYASAEDAPWSDYASEITTVVVGEGVESVSAHAFSGQENLQTVALPSTLEALPESVFQDCTSLSAVTIPKNVDSIGENAFAGCESLDTIRFTGDAPSSVADSAFSGVDAEVYVAAGNETWNEDNMAGYGGDLNWNEITYSGDVDEDIAWSFDATGGVLTISGSGAMPSYTWANVQPWAEFAAEIKKMVITSGITEIGSCAFDYLENLTEVEMADSVTVLGEAAFRDSKNLKKVKFSANLETIGSLAFRGCVALISITIPDSVTVINEEAFWDCKSLTQMVLPSGLRKLGGGAFWGCENLQSINIPGNVTTIEAFTFSGCKKLADVSIEEGVQTISGSAFGYCQGLVSLVIPRSVQLIKSKAFEGCTNLGVIQFADAAPVFEENAFLDVTANVYYNPEMGGWYGGQTGNNYGGKITWISYGNGNQQVVMSGSCGENARWYYEESDTSGWLRITGTGSMYNYSTTGDPDYPWPSSATGGKPIHVVVEKGITHVGDGAFRGMYTDSIIDLPDSLKSIGNYAFAGCSDTITLSIPDGVVTIGDGAFKDMTSWISYALPYGLTSLGSEVFANCVQMVAPEIPETVTYIGSSAFSGCSNIRYILFKGQVPTFEDPSEADCLGTFYGYNKTVYYPSLYTDWAEAVQKTYGGNPRWAVYAVELSGNCGESARWVFDQDSGVLYITGTGSVHGNSTFHGVIYNGVNNNCCPWYFLKDQIKHVEVAEGITSIDYCTLEGCGNIESVQLPSSLTSLGNYAFGWCTSLTQITLPENLTTIGYGAFVNCENLQSVVIPDGVEEIDERAFDGCKALKDITIPDSVTKLGEWAFAGTALQQISIPGSVGTIPVSCFRLCTDLQKVTLGEGITHIGSAAFLGCAVLSSITLPKSLLKIGDRAFGSCRNLTAITIPENVVWLDAGVFEECYFLQSVTFTGDAPGFHDNAFEGQNMIAYYPGDNDSWTEDVLQDYGGNITWKPIVNAFGEYDFNLVWSIVNGTLIIEGTDAIPAVTDEEPAPWWQYNDMIYRIVIKDDVAGIGDRAFQSCSNVESIYIGSAVAQIGSNITADCINLKTIQVANQNSLFTAVDDVLFDKDMKTLYAYPSQKPDSYFWIPDSVIAVKGAFQFCQNLETLVIGTGMTYVGGDFRIAMCSNLKTVHLPHTVTRLDTAAFYGLNLTTVNLPEDLVSIGDFAFWGCSLEYITIPGKVTSIGCDAFAETSLKNITIPASVTSIGADAFAYSTKLETITFMGNAPTIDNNVYKGTFAGCDLTAYYPANNDTWTDKVMQQYGGKINWVASEDLSDDVGFSGRCGDNLTWIFDEGTGILTIYGSGSMYNYEKMGNSAPWRNLNISKVVLEYGVTSIGNYAFSGCSAVTLELYDGLLSIGDYAFEGASLKMLHIPDSVVYLGSKALYGCVHLTDVSLPNGITKIGESTFDQCLSLQRITIPSGVGSIGSRAFAYCSNLEEITFAGKAPAFAEDAFYNTTTVARYSEKDDSWTEEVRQDYGGTITWLKMNEKLPAGPELPDLEYTNASGTWGDNITWVLTDQGVLTISGKGAMMHFTESDEPFTAPEFYPWQKYASGITSLVVEEGITALAHNAFSNLKLLQSVTLPGSLKDMADNTFTNCYSLITVNLGSGVTDIGQSSFGSCVSLQEITIPSNVKLIDCYAFDGCKNLTNVTMESGVEVIAKNAFRRCAALTEITLPDTVHTIQYSAFESTGLNMLTIPAGVTTLDKHVFYGSNSLQILVFEGDVPQFDSNTMYGLTATAYYPDDNGTWEAGVLQSYGGNITWIPKSAIGGTIKPGMCGDNLTWTFDEVKGTLIISGTGDMYHFADAPSPWQKYADRIIAVRAEEGVTSIGMGAFDGYLSLKEVHLADTVGYIADSAFACCPKLTNVNIPDSVHTIGCLAFDQCTSLKTITFGNGVKTIDTMAFRWCALQNITFLGNAPKIGENAFFKQGANAWYPADNDTWTDDVKQNYGGTLNWVVIGTELSEPLPVPEYTNASGTWGDNITWKLTDDGVLTFSGTGAIISYSELPDDSMVSEYWYPWRAYALAVETVVVEEGITSIPLNAFNSMHVLKKVVLPDSLQNLGDQAFINCKQLKNVTLGNSLTTIGQYAFGNCSSLMEIRIPGSVKKLGHSAFNACVKLSNVTLAPGLSTIDSEVFKDCVSLSTISLPSSVRSIGKSAFEGCTGLTEFNFPANIGSLDNLLFYGCSNLKELHFTGNAPKFADYTFFGLQATVYYKDGSNWQSAVTRTYGGDIQWVFDGMVAERIWLLLRAGSVSTSDMAAVGQVFTVDVDSRPWNSNMNLKFTAEGPVEVIGTASRWINLRGLKPGTATVTVTDTVSGLTSKITIRIVEPTAITAPFTADVPFTPDEDQVFYTFTPETTMKYIITLGDEMSYISGLGMDLDVRSFPDDGYVEMERYQYGVWNKYVMELEAGTTYLIRAYCREKEYVNSIPIRLMPEAPVEGISLPAAKATVYHCDHPDFYNGFTIPVEFTPTDAVGEVTWTSSNPDIVSFESNNSGRGFFRSHGYGTAVITAVCGAYSESMEITVAEPKALTLGKPLTDVKSVMSQKYYAFTAKEDGVYRFSVESEWFFGISDGTVETYESQILRQMKAGETCYVFTEGNVRAPENAEFTVLVKKMGTPSSMRLEFMADGSEILSVRALFEPVNTYDNIVSAKSSDPNILEDYSIWMDYARFMVVGTGKVTITVVTESGLKASHTIRVGRCGNSMIWVLDRYGTLYIMGYGEMDDLSNGSPWDPWAEEIRSVVVSSGVRTIGHYAFRGLSNLTEVILPDTIREIGEAAFGNCTSLTGIDLPEGIYSISCSAFAQCTALKKITFPRSLRVAGPFLFDGCTALTDVIFTGNLPDLGPEFFWGVTTTAWYPDENNTWTKDALQQYGGTITWKPLSGWVESPEVSGTFDYNLTWTFNKDTGTLTLGGHGSMMPFDKGAPWQEWSSEITQLVIGTDVQSLVDKAFAGCTALTEIVFQGKAPYSINQNAFQDVTATVYYSAGWNWEPDLLQNYGGNLTWVQTGVELRKIDFFVGGNVLAVGQESGVYITISPWNALTDLKVSVEDTDIAQIVAVNIDGQSTKNVTLKGISAGKTRLIVEDTKTGIRAVCEITVMTPTAISCPYTTELTIPEGESHRFFSFTPDADGKYEFAITTFDYVQSLVVGYGDFILISCLSGSEEGMNVDYGSDGESQFITADLKAGSTYLIEIPAFASAYSQTVTFTAGLAEDSADSLRMMSTSHNYTLDPGETLDVFVYVQYSGTGKLVWTSSDESVAEIVATNSEYCEVKLKKPGEADITVSVDGQSATTHIQVNEVEYITLGETKTANGDIYGVHKDYIFVAPETGKYAFTVTSDAAYPRLEINTYCDDSVYTYGDNTTTLICSLKAGESYRFFAMSDAPSCTVTVTKAEQKPKSMELVVVARTQNYMYLAPSFAPANSSELIVSWQIDDPSVAGESSNPNISSYQASKNLLTLDIYKKGYVTITATTQSGLQSSITLYVGQCLDGHTFGPWTPVLDAGGAETGHERRECANCDEFNMRPTRPFDPNAENRIILDTS
ncbi:MAG: leucine-rich repeat protein, partial [Oscillospiraceae bacterium]|nr:leucine-rich repeat protein [Oscillospiraceae bacterium]